MYVHSCSFSRGRGRDFLLPEILGNRIEYSMRLFESFKLGPMYVLFEYMVALWCGVVVET